MSCNARVWAEHPLPGRNVLVPAGAIEAFSWLHFSGGTLLGLGRAARGRRGPGSPWGRGAVVLPWAWDSRATGTVTLQTWHQRNLTAAVKGKAAAGSTPALGRWPEDRVLSVPPQFPNHLLPPKLRACRPPRCLAGATGSWGRLSPRDWGRARWLCSLCPAVGAPAA